MMQEAGVWDGRPSWITGDIFASTIPMATLHAWEPWEWCRSILFQLHNSDIDNEHPEWRIPWIAGVTLLRTVGHVLGNVDTRRSEAHSAEITRFWNGIKTSKDRNWIFFEFVESERNSILKEFSFGASLPPEEDDRVLAYTGTHLDGAQLFREAVYWWRAQLLAIEEAVSKDQLMRR